MADEGSVGFIEERVDFSQRVGVVNNKNKFSRESGFVGSSNDHVTGQNFSKVANVELSAWRDASGNDVALAALGKPLCHHIAPMHGFTSNRNGSNKTSQGDIIDFVAGCFVDKNDGEDDITTDFPDGLDGL